MNAEEFHAAALALPGAEFDVKWGDHRTYCVGGKMFALAGALGEERPCWTLKVSDASFDQLCEEGVAAPSAYIGRYKWVRFVSNDAIPDDQLMAYLQQAHAIVAAKLPTGVRKGLGIG